MQIRGWDGQVNGHLSEFVCLCYIMNVKDNFDRGGGLGDNLPWCQTVQLRFKST
ncbi:MAG: hypothetical protein AMXMBFR75_21110 [Candidatus Hinthialibacteria bacterium]